MTEREAFEKWAYTELDTKLHFESAWAAWQAALNATHSTTPQDESLIEKLEALKLEYDGVAEYALQEAIAIVKAHQAAPSADVVERVVNAIDNYPASIDEADRDWDSFSLQTLAKVAIAAMQDYGTARGASPAGSGAVSDSGSIGNHPAAPTKITPTYHKEGCELMADPTLVCTCGASAVYGSGVVKSAEESHTDGESTLLGLLPSQQGDACIAESTPTTLTPEQISEAVEAATEASYWHDNPTGNGKGMPLHKYRAEAILQALIDLGWRQR